MSLGEQIRKARQRYGFSQDELAKKAGISRVSIGNYERDTRTPKSDVLQKIAAALRTSTDYLLEKTPYFDSDYALDAVFKEYPPSFELDTELESFLDEIGFVCYSSIFDFDFAPEDIPGQENLSKLKKIEEWKDPQKRYFVIEHNNKRYKVQEEDLRQFQENIYKSIEFEFFKLPKDDLSN